MLRNRSIEELLSDSKFIDSEEYRTFKALVDCGAYPTVEDAILSLIKACETVREEDRRNFPDEIAAAVAADKADKKIPPLHAVANCIRDLDFDAIPPEHWYMLADFLSCEHRAKKGEKKDREFSKECDLTVLELYDQMLGAGIKPSHAVEKIACKHRTGLRSIQRMIARAKKRKETDESVERLGKLDILRFFDDDT